MPGCHPQPSISRLNPWSTTSEDFFSTPSELVGDQCFRAMFFADKVPVYCKEKHISYRLEINTLITNELRAVATRMFDVEVFNRTQPEDQKVDALVGYDIVQFQMEISKAHKRYYSVLICDVLDAIYRARTLIRGYRQSCVKITRKINDTLGRPRSRSRRNKHLVSLCNTYFNEYTSWVQLNHTRKILATLCNIKVFKTKKQPFIQRCRRRV